MVFSSVFLVANANLVIAAPVDQQVILEGRFRVAAFDPRGEAAICCFDVAIAMVNADDVNSVFVFHLIFLSKIVFAHLFDLAPVRSGFI